MLLRRREKRVCMTYFQDGAQGRQGDIWKTGTRFYDRGHETQVLSNWTNKTRQTTRLTRFREKHGSRWFSFEFFTEIVEVWNPYVLGTWWKEAFGKIWINVDQKISYAWFLTASRRRTYVQSVSTKEELIWLVPGNRNGKNVRKKLWGWLVTLSSIWETKLTFPFGFARCWPTSCWGESVFVSCGVLVDLPHPAENRLFMLSIFDSAVGWMSLFFWFSDHVLAADWYVTVVAVGMWPSRVSFSL